MIKNSFLASLRALLKNKGTFSLNLLALTIGISACIVAYLHIMEEQSYDQHFAKKSRIYRVVTGDVSSGEGWVKVSTPIPPKLKEELPEVESFTRLTKFSYAEKVSVEYEDNIYNEENVFLADPAFFSIFDLKLTRGSNSEMQSNSIFISSSTASKYFRNEDPIGKTISIDGRMDFNVSGVFADIPPTSHFFIDFIIPFENLEKVKPGTSLTGNWGQFNYFAYLLLDEKANPKLTDSKIKSIVAEYGENQSMEFENLGLQALTDIHFQHNRGNLKASYNPIYLTVYAAVAFAILLISFINFVNLSIASSTRRIKEVGVRKVLGASRMQLIIQFVMESIVITTVAAAFALLLTALALPYVNTVIDSMMTVDFQDIQLLIGLVLLIALLASSSGFYISIFILSFNPVNAVKGVIKVGNKGKFFKGGLVTLQFAISCILILSSVFIYKQLSYLVNRDIGLNKDGIITLQLFNKQSQKEAGLLIPELEKIAGVTHVSASRFTPGSVNWHQTVIWEDQKNETSWNLISVDEHFLTTFEVELLEGNVSSIENASGGAKNRYIINESALKETGWEEALGKSISPYGKNGYAPIVGVTKNFNYKSLHNDIEPCLMIISNNDLYNQISIKYSTSDIASLLGDLESTFISILPSTPFEYAFAEDQFSALYNVESQTSQMIGILTSVAIILALLGVYALLSFTVKERTKEIAIRKVLGIKLRGTISLLAGNYIKLLAIANLVGIPIAWKVITLWLQNFSYQSALNPTVFVAVSLLTVLLILVVVSLKALQVERINPTSALKYE